MLFCKTLRLDSGISKELRSYLCGSFLDHPFVNYAPASSVPYNHLDQAPRLYVQKQFIVLCDGARMHCI